MVNVAKRFAYLLFLCGLLATSVSVYAQFSGNISGVVADSTGAIVPNSTVTLRNTATGEQRTTVSTGAGIYQFVSLAPGSYDISATMKGFSTSKITVNLETGQTLNAPIRLAIG